MTRLAGGAAQRTRGTRRGGFRLERWQTVLAAAIGAAGAITATILTVDSGHGGGSPGDSTPYITSVSQRALPHGVVSYTFSGTVANLPAGDQIYVLPELDAAESADPTSLSLTANLMSPAASVNNSGGWTVTWQVSNVPSYVKWVAAVIDESCPPGAACATAPATLAPEPGPS
jgi:hypothetical protein